VALQASGKVGWLIQQIRWQAIFAKQRHESRNLMVCL
jgi:hypothetical protein